MSALGAFPRKEGRVYLLLLHMGYLWMLSSSQVYFKSYLVGIEVSLPKVACWSLTQKELMRSSPAQSWFTVDAKQWVILSYTATRSKAEHSRPMQKDSALHEICTIHFHIFC